MPAPSDLVHETSTTTGTGNFTLVNENGKRSFNTAFGTGGTDVFDYYISNRDAAEWERGTGHLSAASTLVRDTVLASSNAGAAVNFSAGTKDVTNDVPAAKQITTENTATTSAAGISELLTTTELLTGTDTTRAATADAIASLWEKGSDVASAATISLGEGHFFHITGTTTITDIDFATAKDGRAAILEFDGALTLTYNATTLRLPGNANIITVAGDWCLVVQDATDNVRVVHYQRKMAPPGSMQCIFGNLGSATPQAQNTTRYYGPGFPATPESSDAAAAIALPPGSGRKVKISNLAIVGINPPAGQTITATIRNAGTGVDSAVTCTINNGTNVASDTTNSVVMDNDNGGRPVLKVVTSATSGDLTTFIFSYDMLHFTG